MDNFLAKDVPKLIDALKRPRKPGELLFQDYEGYMLGMGESIQNGDFKPIVPDLQSLLIVLSMKELFDPFNHDSPLSMVLRPHIEKVKDWMDWVPELAAYAQTRIMGNPLRDAEANHSRYEYPWLYPFLALPDRFIDGSALDGYVHPSWIMILWQSAIVRAPKPFTEKMLAAVKDGERGFWPEYTLLVVCLSISNRTRFEGMDEAVKMVQASMPRLGFMPDYVAHLAMRRCHRNDLDMMSEKLMFNAEENYKRLASSLAKSDLKWLMEQEYKKVYLGSNPETSIAARICSLCGTRTFDAPLYLCAGCECVRVCSEQCLANHYETHKMECPYFAELASKNVVNPDLY